MQTWRLGALAVLVLVVDDEPISRMAHMAVLAKIRNISVIGAATVAEARALIQEAAPQVVVLDMRLPDGTGLDVIAALEAASANALVIVASAYLDDYRGKLPRSERVHLLGKPVPMHELRRLVENAVNNTSTLSPFTVLDYVQLACMGHHSAIIECYGKAGRGEIIIEKGELWSAEDRLGTGVPAFDRLLMAKRANARPLTDRRQLPPRNLTERWELMVLDTLRAQDEQGTKAAPTLPSPPATTQGHAPATPTKIEPSAIASAATSMAPPAVQGPGEKKPLPAVAQSSIKPSTAGASPDAPSAGAAEAPKIASVVEARIKGGLPPQGPAATLPSTAPEAPTSAPARLTGETSSTRTQRGDDNFDACVERALRAVVAKNFALAISELERAQAIRPGDPLVTHRLARLRSLLG
ncbi:MAG: response regulator [Myxococcales bacterium]|nr:response regulator [Myxococcales bacterium]